MFPTLPRRPFLAGLTGAAALPLFSLPSLAQRRVPRIRSDNDILHLDPFDFIGGVEETLKMACLMTLVRYVEQGSTEVEPYAAQSIEAIDDRTVRFVLRDDILWSDGYGPLSAEDVKFSFERIADPDGGSPWQYTWEALDHVEVVDNLTGIIHMKQPFAPLFTTSLPALAGSIVCKRALEDVGGTFTTSFPAQCGPYRLVDWQPSVKIVLEHNPDWAGPEPDFDGFEILVIPDDKTAEIAFEAGELDFTEVTVDSILRYRDNPPEDSRLMEAPPSGYSWLGMNTDHPNLQDERVRRAIQYAVDIDMILQGAYSGLAGPATGIIGPGQIGHRDARMVTGRDLDQARNLLAEAGVPNGFQTTLSCLNDTTSRTVCEIIQANLSEVGISADIRTYDPAVYWNLGVESEGDDWRDLELTLMRYSTTADPAYMTVWFTPEQIGVWNWERWASDEYGALNDEAMREMDATKRSDKYVAMQDLMEQSGAYHFITDGARAVLTRSWMQPFLFFGRAVSLPQFKLV
ncbi:MAG: ABC transporter substrate-binding protein [Pseudomonadota bacterium]